MSSVFKGGSSTRFGLACDRSDFLTLLAFLAAILFSLFDFPLEGSALT